MTMRAFSLPFSSGIKVTTPPLNRRLVQLFNFHWLARSDAGSLLLLFTYSSRRRLFINQTFFEQFTASDFQGIEESPSGVEATVRWRRRGFQFRLEGGSGDRSEPT